MTACSTFVELAATWWVVGVACLAIFAGFGFLNWFDKKRAQQ